MTNFCLGLGSLKAVISAVFYRSQLNYENLHLWDAAAKRSVSAAITPIKCVTFGRIPGINTCILSRAMSCTVSSSYRESCVSKILKTSFGNYDHAL